MVYKMAIYYRRYSNWINWINISTILLFFAYRALYNYIVSNVFIANLITPSFIFGPLGLVFILGGTIIGAVGSAFALRKFLDV